MRTSERAFTPMTAETILPGLKTCVCSLQALSKDELIALDRLVGHGMYEHTNMGVCVCVCACVYA